MEKLRVCFVERKFDYFVSVEKVFRLVSEGLDVNRFQTSFRQLPYLSTVQGMLGNLLRFRPDPDADVYHVTGHCHYIALILPADRTVLTIHDLGFLRYRRGLRRWMLKKLLLDLPLRRLKYVTAISEATRKEIVAAVPGSYDKIRVVENPLDDLFTLDSKPGFNVSEPNILQIGTSPNKNLENLIRAIEELSCRLTIIGEASAELKERLERASIKYRIRSGISNQSLKQEYENADVVAFCSTLEGFGLPIIEAQSMRTPVLTSDLSPMKDVAGEGGAALVDPTNPESIRKGLIEIIQDAELRKKLTENGLRNVCRFNKQAIAIKYATLYNEIADGFRPLNDKANDQEVHSRRSS